MPFGCFVGHFFLHFPLSKFFRGVSPEEKGVQSEYHRNLNCWVHIQTHALISAPAQQQCVIAVSVCIKLVQVLWHLQADLWSRSSKAGSVAEYFFFLVESVFFYSDLAVPSWRFFPWVATFLLISRIKSTFCFKPNLSCLYLNSDFTAPKISTQTDLCTQCTSIWHFLSQSEYLPLISFCIEKYKQIPVAVN